jgi:hypothetical protein
MTSQPVAKEIPAPLPPPVRLVPDRPLPSYRFVPGLHPHPFRHKNGHLYTDGSPPEERPWDREQAPEADVEFLFGVDLFNHRYFWEAHETWEAIWHQVDRTDPRAELFQALIQAGAYALQQHRGKTKSAKRLLAAVLRRFEIVTEQVGSQCHSVDLVATAAGLRRFEASGEFPKIVLGSDGVGVETETN